MIELAIKFTELQKAYGDAALWVVGLLVAVFTILAPVVAIVFLILFCGFLHVMNAAQQDGAIAAAVDMRKALDDAIHANTDLIDSRESMRQELYDMTELWKKEAKQKKNAERELALLKRPNQKIRGA